MKKALVILALPLFCLSVLGAPICSINQEMNKDTASQLSQFRKQTTDTCLACEGDTCKLRLGPKNKKVMKRYASYYFAHRVMFQNFLKSLIM